MSCWEVLSGVQNHRQIDNPSIAADYVSCGGTLSSLQNESLYSWTVRNGPQTVSHSVILSWFSERISFPLNFLVISWKQQGVQKTLQCKVISESEIQTKLHQKTTDFSIIWFLIIFFSGETDQQHWVSGFSGCRGSKMCFRFRTDNLAKIDLHEMERHEVVLWVCLRQLHTSSYMLFIGDLKIFCTIKCLLGFSQFKRLAPWRSTQATNTKLQDNSRAHCPNRKRY